MKRMTAMMLLVSVGLLAGCEEQKADAPEGDKASKLEEIRENAKKAAKAGGADPTKDLKRTWELQVDGQPKLDGFKVLTTDIGPLRKYSMMGSNSMVNLDIKDGKPDPWAVMANFTDSQLSCIYRAGKKYDGKGMTVKISGNRGEISGEITCTKVAEKGKPQTTSKITGWFEF